MNDNVDSDEYTKVIKDHIFDFLDLHELFQQDNGPVHTMIKTKKMENGFILLEN